MSPDLLTPVAAPGCLSAWQVPKLAIGLRDPAQAHLDACNSCAGRVHEEQEAAQAAATQRVPEGVLARAGTPRWRRHLRLPSTALAVLAGLLTVALVARLVWIWQHAG